MLTLVSIVLLALYVIFSSATVEVAADLAVPLFLSIASAWARYIDMNGILYIGIASFMTMVASLAGMRLPNPAMRAVIATQALFPILAIIYLAVTKPELYYIPLLGAVIVTIKSGIWDQVFLKENGKLHVW